MLALAFLGTFTTLQGIINYGIVLGLIRYKHHVVGRDMGMLLGLGRNPLTALQTIAESSSNKIVIAASCLSSTFVLGVSGWLLAYVLWSAPGIRANAFLGGALACAALWLGTLLCGLGLVRSIVTLERQSLGTIGASPAAAGEPAPPQGVQHRES
jgi:hypothetical protein